MTLEEAYIRRKQENMALKRENARLSATVESLRKGTYSNPEKIAHINQISALTRKALLRLTQNNPYSLQELCTADS